MNNIFSKLIPSLITGIILLITFIGCQGQTTPPSSPTTSAKEIMVFAGSSSKAAMEPAGKAFQTKTGIKVYFNFSGSGILLSQMKLSKTGDLFIPASPDYIVKATADGVIYPDTEAKIYYLVPAMLVQKGNPSNIKSLVDLAKPGLKIAIADPQMVPAGLFAYEILNYNNLLSDVGKNIVTYSESNEKVSSLVLMKAVDAVIAWDVIALQQPNNVDVVYLQPNQVPRISYMSGAVATFTKDKESAQSFLKYLVSAEGQDFFKKNGYYTTENEAKKLAPNAQVGGEYKLPADYKPLVK